MTSQTQTPYANACSGASSGAPPPAAPGTVECGLRRQGKMRWLASYQARRAVRTWMDRNGTENKGESAESSLPPVQACRRRGWRGTPHPVLSIQGGGGRCRSVGVDARQGIQNARVFLDEPLSAHARATTHLLHLFRREPWPWCCCTCRHSLGLGLGGRRCVFDIHWWADARRRRRSHRGQGGRRRMRPGFDDRASPRREPGQARQQGGGGGRGRQVERERCVCVPNMAVDGGRG